MLINIGLEYLALVSAIQKDWKKETTNLAKAVLQIIRYFEFMETIEKGKLVLQTSTSKPAPAAPKRSCKNPKYIKKSLTTHYTDRYWIKPPELRQNMLLAKCKYIAPNETSKLNQVKR